MKKSDIYFVFQELTKKYHGATTELIYHTPFQLLVAVIMSAQTTDKQVNKVTAHFFDTIKAPIDLLKIPYEKWESMIAGVNYYKNKAKNIYKLSQILIEQAKIEEKNIKENITQKKKNNNKIKNKIDEENIGPIKEEFLQIRGYRIPDTQKELVALPGVGEKTAKVIQQVLHNQAVIAVDTHVHRVTNRLGIVKTDEPLQTSKILEKKVPEEFRMDAHHALILFGRYHCTARNPQCESCPFQNICPYYKKNIKTNKKTTGKVLGKKKKGKDI